MPPSLAAQPVANARLLGLVREAVLAPLTDVFADVIDGLREPMLERARQMGLDHAQLLDGMFALRQQREALLAGYSAQLVRAWQALESGAPPPALLAFDSGGDHLGLVQHDELEVQLAIQHLADALAREWKPQLLLLNGYLGWVDSSLRMEADSNPLSPQQVAMAVYRGFAAIGLPDQIRQVAIQCCERELIERVGPIYENVHACLIREFGVPDTLSARSRGSLLIPTSEEESAAQEPDWLSRFFIQWSDSDAAASAPQAAVQASAGAVLPPALHELLEGSRAAREQVPGREPPSGPRNELSQRELLSILTLLQIAPETVAATLARAQGPELLKALKREMFSVARQLGVQAEAVRLASADENIIDLIGMLFQVMFEECDLGPRQRALLSRLIAPMTKVALQDRQLFLQSTHPARRLLNLLAEACEGNHGQTPQEQALLERVEQTVERLVAEFDESQAVFRSLRGDFNDYYSQHRGSVDKAEQQETERQRAEEALAKARTNAVEVLRARLEGRGLPLPVRYLLQEDWVAYAAALELGGRPQAATALMDGMLQALETARRGDPRKQQTWEPVADWLQPVWMASGQERAQVEHKRSMLLEALRHMGSLSAAGAVEAAPEAEPPPLAEPALASAYAPLSTEELQAVVDFDKVTAEYFSTLPLGTWLDFIDKDNRVQAGKLSWVSPISSRLMFVNRAGARICVASVEELVAMVQLKRLRLHRDDDAFHSAMQGVIDRLEPAPPAAR